MSDDIILLVVKSQCGCQGGEAAEMLFDQAGGEEMRDWTVNMDAIYVSHKRDHGTVIRNHDGEAIIASLLQAGYMSAVKASWMDD